MSVRIDASAVQLVRAEAVHDNILSSWAGDGGRAPSSPVDLDEGSRLSTVQRAEAAAESLPARPRMLVRAASQRGTLSRAFSSVTQHRSQRRSAVAAASRLSAA